MTAPGAPVQNAALASRSRRAFIGSALAAGLSWESISRGLVQSEAGAFRATDPHGVAREHWDYVIVGAGAAGCVLANRLSADPNTRVLLLEAGGSTFDDPNVSMPQAWPALAGGAFDWHYRTAAQPNLDGRALAYPRGFGLGGSTSINALGYMRGAARAYDAWAAVVGNPAWSFDALLPFFKRSENFFGGAGPYHGDDGPMHVYPVAAAPAKNPLSVAFHEAAAARYGRNADWNGAQTEGAAWTQLTLANGSRDTAATAYLRPAGGRPNLAVVTGARARRLEIEAPRCTALQFEVGGSPFRVSNARDIVLCAGSIDTPRLLMLSGIGPAAGLEAVDIPTVLDRPGVGSNLQDHLLVAGVLLESKRPIPQSQFNHSESLALTHGLDSAAYADVLLMGLTVPFVLPGLATVPEHAFSVIPAFLKPLGHGEVSLVSADPAVPPRIDPGFLRESSDLDQLVHAIGAARELAHQPELREWVKAEVYPGPGHGSHKTLRAVARAAASSFYHPVGTCRAGAGTDPRSVVDAQFRVHGLSNVRIVDASVFPSIPQAMTEAATLAVAEFAAALMVAG